MEDLKHPNIVQVYEHVEIGRNYVIYMELAANGELFSRVISAGCLSEDDARPYFAQVASAVEYMHNCGVAHRDLKLENVLIDGNNTCKVCDFGLSHVYDRCSDGSVNVEILTQVCGSKSYCAPEVLEGKGYVGFPTDVWSCGICLFGMLAGFFPLDEASGSDWRYERVKLATSQRCSVTHTIFGFYERPCLLSRHVTELIDGMMNIDAPSRLTISDVLASPWLTQKLPAGPPPGAPPVYRSGSYDVGKGGLDQAAIDAMYDAPESPPIYRGGPAPEPPPLLAKQEAMFHADFGMDGAVEADPV